MFQKPNAVETPRYEKPNAYDEEVIVVTASRQGSRSSRMTNDSYSSRFFSYHQEITPSTSPPSSPKCTYQPVCILSQPTPTTQTSFHQLEITDISLNKGATIRRKRSTIVDVIQYFISQHGDILDVRQQLIYRKLSFRSWTNHLNTLVDVQRNKRVVNVKRKTFKKEHITIELENNPPEYFIKTSHASILFEYKTFFYGSCIRWKRPSLLSSDFTCEIKVVSNSTIKKDDFIESDSENEDDEDHDHHNHKTCRRWKLLAEYTDDVDCLEIQRQVLTQVGGDKRDLLEINLIITCSIFAVLSSAQSYLPIYYHDTLGFSSDQIGLVLAIAPFVQSISCPLWTFTVDKKPNMHGFIMALTSFLGGLATIAIMFIGHSSYFGFELSNTVLVIIVSCLALGFAFFTLPNMALVDSAVMKILGPNKILYGEQRLWGSVSAALTILIVGQLISITGNLDTLFYTFAASTAVFIILALFTKPSHYEEMINTDQDDEEQPIQRIKTSEKLYNRATNYSTIPTRESGEESRYVDLFKTNSLASVHTIREEADEALDRTGLDLGLAISRIASVDQSLASIFEHTAEDIPSPQIFKSPRILTFLITTLLFGFVLSIIINFLFIFLNGELHMPTSWIGWTGPTTGITELLCFCFSKQLQERFGVTKMIITAHVAIIVRCLIYTVLVPDLFITNIIALLLQTLHGIGFGIFWATSVSEMDSFFPPEQRSVAQGILGALHFGLGTGLGALAGGYLYQYLGSVWMFRSAALICTLNMFIFYIGRLERYNF
ncbi:hypothetical protein G6F57_010701 [Rhizopus arrhizus]|nr:hypothetical protein G6F23_006975 [Rhizopus arrhizus]KAG0759188.1 hypothetical protein G6F24_009252 [Rhizopus arrhizus]KAG0808150.1 hypothetical protein G6F20_009811 [Rhizopus arrhizus]KAG0826565.1 hypothetical protein G6F19_009230 [Rhizopus arrhizus]KAG0826639.1 hypothetical protein G6F18_009860 [Rhizopus arrhizus]